MYILIFVGSFFLSKHSAILNVQSLVHSDGTLRTFFPYISRIDMQVYAQTAVVSGRLMDVARDMLPAGVSPAILK